jgi:hypothetical protein
MSDSRSALDRDRQVRRTLTARRGVIAAGTLGAVGAAVAVGVTTQTADAGGDDDDQTGSVTQPARQDAQQDQTEGQSQDQSQQQSQDSSRQQSQARPAPSDGQLAAPGGSGPPQGGSGGS